MKSSTPAIVKQQPKDKLVEHKQYMNKNGEDLPEIQNCNEVHKS
jgi:phosphoketolase